MGEEEEDFTAEKRRTTTSTAADVAEWERRYGRYGTGRQWSGDGGRFGVSVGDGFGDNDNEFGCRNGGGEEDGHNQGSQAVRVRVRVVRVRVRVVRVRVKVRARAIGIRDSKEGKARRHLRLRKRSGLRRGSVAARDSSEVERDAVLIFLIPARVRGRSTLSVVAYSGRGRGEKGSWRKSN